MATAPVKNKIPKKTNKITESKEYVLKQRKVKLNIRKEQKMRIWKRNEKKFVFKNNTDLCCFLKSKNSKIKDSKR